jgi:hypothetical protein
MRVSPALKIVVLIAGVCLYAQGQSTPNTDALAEAKGMPPRAAPSDYQAHDQAGTVTVAAEFTGHSIPTPQGILTTEDYVAVETGLFGQPGARIRISADDFTLRINGKKTPLSSLPYGLVVGNVKDPEWEPPTPASSKTKTSINGKADELPPAPVKVPIEVQRAMAERIRKAYLPEGDRALPVAGLIFFQYGGKTKNIRTMELIYAGAAGNVTLDLQP